MGIMTDLGMGTMVVVITDLGMGIMAAIMVDIMGIMAAAIGDITMDTMGVDIMVDKTMAVGIMVVKIEDT
jgi:hypothetical protein